MNDPDVRRQLLRLEQISQLFHGISPHVQILDQNVKKYRKLAELRRVTMLDAIDTITTVDQSTCICVCEEG